MSYDQAEWHSGGNYPDDLPAENGGTHIGMFLAWVIVNGMEGDELREYSSESLEAVRARRMTGREFLFKECDGKLCEWDLNEECNAFARYYYSAPECIYLKDYAETLAADLPSVYHVQDTWENYEKIAAVITERFKDWKRKRSSAS